MRFSSYAFLIISNLDDALVIAWKDKQREDVVSRATAPREWGSGSGSDKARLAKLPTRPNHNQHPRNDFQLSSAHIPYQRSRVSLAWSITRSRCRTAELQNCRNCQYVYHWHHERDSVADQRPRSYAFVYKQSGLWYPTGCGDTHETSTRDRDWRRLFSQYE